MKRLVLLLTCFIISMSLSIAQTTRVTGTIVDENGEPVVGASVTVKGNASIGTTTNVEGQFALDVPSSATTLIIKYLGMLDQEVAVAPNINAALKPSATALDEVIVVAYGTAKKSSFTGSAATIKSEELQKRKVSNVTKALDGLATGVQVTTGNGQPGSGSSVYIRGLGSINASNAPLYVVDGIPYNGNISAISPSDIETITVLKDAAAGALYGARGANGVVMVTTKKGKIGVTEINVKANFGASDRYIPRYETMKPKAFIEAEYSAFYNQQIMDGKDPKTAGAAALYEMSEGAAKIFGNKEMYNPYNYPIAQLIDPATGLIRSDAVLRWTDDWMDEVTRSDAYREEYGIDLSGGTDKTQYMFSLGYLSDNGLLKTTDFKRYSGRINLESKPFEWFSAGLGSNFARTETSSLGSSGSTTSNVWYSAQLMGPIFPVYLRDPSKDGAFILDENGKKTFDYGTSRPAGQQGDFNSVATLFDDKYFSAVNNLSARTHIDVGGLKDGALQGLKLSVSLGFDYYGSNGLTYYNPYFGNAASSNGRVSKTSGTTFSYTTNQLLSYNRSFNDIHHLDLIASHEWYDFQYSYLSGQKTGFPFGGLTEPDAASTVTDVSGYSHKYTIESYLGRLNYDYADKYYLSASIRRDASSRFYKENRWGNFWSLGANYRISQEAFMSDLTWLNNLAVRASYGEQGNDNVNDYYPWQSLYDLGYANANESGALVNKVANQDLSWEKSNILNIGLDASFWDSRLQIALEWFNRKTSDLLLFYPLPMSSGFEGYNRNSGSMKNSGFEATLTGQIVKTNDFQWSVTVMGSMIKNKVLKLTDDGKDILSGSQIIREGEPIYSYYVVRSAGVDPLNGEPLYWANVDGDGKDTDPYITTNTTYALASRYVAGNKQPDAYGSISTQLKYKAVDLSVAANFSYGGKVYDGIYRGLMSFYYPAQAKHVNLGRAWKKPGDITDEPRYEVGKNYPVTDAMLLDASYFTLKNVTLGYTLSSRITKKVGIKDLRLYVAADNLYLFTHLKGLDPQYSITGGGDYVYTPARTISVGLDLKF
jgi:TonB-linked SusC/RagA family outer membrane protein